MENLDESDRKILKILQQDGKISTQDLAKRANLSASPCWRRVRKMEESGVIEKYIALTNPKMLGLKTLAYIHVSLMEHTEEAIQKFDDFVYQQEQVIECCSVTGADDYLLKVVANDPEDLEHFIMHKMLRLGIIRSTTTNFVLRQKKYSTEMPLYL